MALPYATASELRQYLDKIGTEGSESDEVLTFILTNASSIVRSSLRYHIGDPLFDFEAYGAASTKIVRGYSTNEYLFLPPFQAASVTLVEEQTGFNPSSYTSVTDEWIEENTSLWRSGGWNDARYRVTATWGYGPVVSDIKQVTMELAVNIWRSKDKGSFTEMIGAEGGGAIRVVAALTPQQQAVLEAFANPLRRIAV